MMEQFTTLEKQIQELTDLWEPTGHTGVFSPDGTEIGGFCSGFAVHDEVSLTEHDTFYITMRASFLVSYLAQRLQVGADTLADVDAAELFALENMHIFQPLGLKIDPDRIADADCVMQDSTVVSAKEAKTEDAIAVSYTDMQAILRAIVQTKGTSRKKLLAEGFEPFGGMTVASCQHMDYACHLYFDPKSRISILRMENEPQAFVPENGAWTYFNKELRELVLYAGLYPKDVHFVRYSEQNMDAAMGIVLSDAQRHFVLDAPRCLARAYGLGKKAKAFVLREGKVAVGLCVLLSDQKQDLYEIDALLIDSRLQGRGYGDILLTCAKNKLLFLGAKRIIVGLSRDNVVARNLYEKHGFIVFEEDDEELLMEYVDMHCQA